MIKKITLLAGVFCILCAAVPLILYKIFNAGVWASAAIGAALLAAHHFRDCIRKTKTLRNILIILAATGALYVTIMSVAMINRAYFSKPPTTGEIAVVVLGAKINGGQPSLVLRRRLDKAYDYMKENDSAICVVTGGQGSDEIMPEAWVMRDYLAARGIDPAKILIDDKSKSTRQNLGFAARLIPDGYQAAIATDGFHQLRAGIFAKAAGVDAPYCVSSATPQGLLPVYWLRELFGIPAAIWISR